MAFQIETDFQGIAVPTAYARVEDVVIRTGKRAPSLTFRVASYASQAAYDAGNCDPIAFDEYVITALREPDPEAEQPKEGPPTVLLPSYDDLVGSALTTAGDKAGTSIFALVKRNLYAFLATRQKWKGAVSV